MKRGPGGRPFPVPAETPLADPMISDPAHTSKVHRMTAPPSSAGRIIGSSLAAGCGPAHRRRALRPLAARIKMARMPAIPNQPIIDADTHITEPPDVWTSRVPAKWRGRVPEVRFVTDEQAEYWFIDGNRAGKVGQTASAGWAGRFPD